MNDFLNTLLSTGSLLLQVPASGESSAISEISQAPLTQVSGSFVELLEYGLVAIVILLQLWFFNQTRGTIRSFKKSLPDYKQFSLTNATVFRSDLKDVPPQQLLDNLTNYTKRAQASAPDLEALRYTRLQEYIGQGMTFDEADEQVQEEFGNEGTLASVPINGKTTLTLLTIATDEESPILTKIRRAINTYLISNKGAVADFNLLRDIIQRNLDTVEEEIAVTTPIPVYLGLVGTMLGIIIGLFSLPDIGSESFIQGNGIANLLGGVKIAMIASAVGLILTIFTNGILFRGSKIYTEGNKNDLFTFLQTELLPVLSDSVNAGVNSLNRNLDRFSAQFSESIQQLDGLVQKNYDSMRAQQSALDTLQKIDVSKVANFNIKVLGELKQSMDALERLAFGLKNVDTFVLNARALVERSQDVVGLTDKIGQVLDYTKELQFYLNGHFQELESRGSLITNTVTKLDNVISREIEGLEKNIHARIQAVGEIKIEEDAWLQQAMRENQTALSKLRLLEPLQASLNDFIKENTTAQRSLATTMQNVAKKSTETNEILMLILTDQQQGKIFKRLSSWLFEKKDKS
ncbi:MotA/TolQ/ExbB proton channel family protein [Spirosoma pollinicola]|uniref:MotA/TolQ/ExbB proton channel domain-containing protein n=1 Tax=Spirosoma pollinicola TaxID=2057025 RepID=A0A2K8Z834_9BACT|nr:hypothetical protein [Spirosoma pollinicola]AUD06010.1 hypothetical protein CWM47_31685 [Spirosoma pollinicola]